MTTSQTTDTVAAALLHGPKDIRFERYPRDPEPGPGQVRIRVGCIGVCGSDLHMYEDGRIGETVIEQPAVIGHEFGGTIETVGDATVDGQGEPLAVGQRVAVDPAIPCLACELCQAGHPNLCPFHTFIGVYPTPGALRETMVVPAFCCFPVPDAIPDEHVPMLETLGVAIHAVDLGHIKVGMKVAVVGAGSIGLCVAQMAKLAGAAEVFVTDRLAWRLDAAERLGLRPVHIEQGDPVEAVMRATSRGGKREIPGVDVALEAAWSTDDSLAQATGMLRPGGRLVVVGISGDDRLSLHHSTVRRKGLTIAMCRRMKHTYPRAIALAEAGRVDLTSLITDRYGLAETQSAFERAQTYHEGTIKVMIDCAGR